MKQKFCDRPRSWSARCSEEDAHCGQWSCAGFVVGAVDEIASYRPRVPRGNRHSLIPVYALLGFGLAQQNITDFGLD